MIQGPALPPPPDLHDPPIGEPLGGLVGHHRGRAMGRRRRRRHRHRRLGLGFRRRRPRRRRRRARTWQGEQRRSVRIWNGFKIRFFTVEKGRDFSQITPRTIEKFALVVLKC